MDLFATAHPLTTDLDISSAAFWAQPFDARERTFARLRAEAPVSWHPSVEVGYEHPQQGFWAVTLAEDITTVSHDSERFQSRFGTTLDPLSPDGAAGGFFLNMDPPEHTRYRRLVSAAFTPKAVASIAGRIQANATSIVDSLVGAGDFDFVQACSGRLPMTTVSDIVGVPEADRERVALAAENLVGGADAAGLPPDERQTLIYSEVLYLFQLGADLAAHRRRNPGNDLLTGLVQGEIDGHRLTDENIGQFMVLMAVAGNDTTKQTTTQAMLALRSHPEQRDWLLADFDTRIGPAIEEFVRYASPVLQFTRTAAADTELRGVPISAGDKVAIFYCSGNRDERVFDRPGEFDPRRAPNPHVGFGGGGAHFCLGNGVARTQLRAILGELLRRVPDIEFGEPVQLVSNFINGISELPAHVPAHVG
jgi:cytochrome P450